MLPCGFYQCNIAIQGDGLNLYHQSDSKSTVILNGKKMPTPRWMCASDFWTPIYDDINSGKNHGAVPFAWESSLF